MNIKRILLFLFLILVFSELYAQYSSSFENPGICLINTKTYRSKIIHLDSKIKYWLYNSDKAEKGRILGVKDSSIIIKGKEIKLKDIRKIARRNGLTGPLVIASIVSIETIVGTPLFISLAILNNKAYNMTHKWQFIKSYKCGIDLPKLESFNKNEKLQNDTFPSISFSLNPLNCIFNQCTLEANYKINNKYSIGIGSGLVYPVIGLHGFIDGTDNDYPTGIYKGWLMMFNYKRLNFTKNHWYFEICPFYKYLYYDHYHFTNGFGDDNPDVEWIRSEIANVVGVQFLMGKRIYLDNHLALEPVFGVSFRERFRSYITYWYNEGYVQQGYNTSWGIVHENEFFPGIQIGLKLTFGNFRLN
jgi:hypothetical protein